MKKIAALLLTFGLATLFVNEVRTERRMHCFGCSNVKCIIRAVDERPSVLITHPLEIMKEIKDAPDWWE